MYVGARPHTRETRFSRAASSVPATRDEESAAPSRARPPTEATEGQEGGSKHNPDSRPNPGGGWTEREKESEPIT